MLLVLWVQQFCAKRRGGDQHLVLPVFNEQAYLCCLLFFHFCIQIGLLLQLASAYWGGVVHLLSLQFCSCLSTVHPMAQTAIFI